MPGSSIAASVPDIAWQQTRRQYEILPSKYPIPLPANRIANEHIQVQYRTSHSNNVNTGHRIASA
eukprot:3939948-Rhodomonas_salina.1